HDPTQKKHGKTRTFQSLAKTIGPDREQKGRKGDAPEIGFRPTDQSSRTMTADGGDRNQDGCQKRGEHRMSLADSRWEIERAIPTSIPPAVERNIHEMLSLGSSTT